MQRDDVRRAEQILERQQRHADLGGPLREEVRVVRHDAHAEGARQLRDVRADPAQPHDAHRLAAQLCALELLAVPTPAPHRRGSVGNTPHQREQQAERMLTGADRVRTRGVHHGDAPARRGVDVDRVDPGPRPGHDAQVRRPRQQIGGHPRFTPHDQGVGAGERPVELLLGLARDGHDFDFSGCGEKLQAAVRDPIGDHDAPGQSRAPRISTSNSSRSGTV